MQRLMDNTHNIIDDHNNVLILTVTQRIQDDAKSEAGLMISPRMMKRIHEL